MLLVVAACGGAPPPAGTSAGATAAAQPARPAPAFTPTSLTPVPHREVITIPHTKHIVMYDDPAGFHRALDAFLAAHPR